MTQNVYSDLRVLNEAMYIVNNVCTFDEAARRFGMSKSTLQKHMQKRLPKLAPELSKQVQSVCKANKRLRHMNGISYSSLRNARSRIFNEEVSKSNGL